MSPGASVQASRWPAEPRLVADDDGHGSWAWCPDLELGGGFGFWRAFCDDGFALAGRPHFWHNGPGTVDWVATLKNPRTSDLRFFSHFL